MGAPKVQDILDPSLKLQLQVLCEGNMERIIEEIDINRPGLALTGFFDYFASNRIQLFGKGEYAYLQSLDHDLQKIRLADFFNKDPVALVFTHANRPPDILLELASENNIPILITDLATQTFIIRLNNFLDEHLSPELVIPGVLTEVFGVGVLLQGKSGVGKSETALELVERGHRLVADDVVRIVCRDNQKLYGYVSETIEHHLEIRGLGIISVKDLFGSGSVRKSKRIDLIIHLEDWDPQKEYDRLGIKDKTEEILAVEVTSMVIPVRPGRNVPILVEIAAKNHRLKVMGFHSAQRFNEKLLQVMKDKTEQAN